MPIARCLLLAVLPLLAQPVAAALPQHLRDTGLYDKGSTQRAARRRRLVHAAVPAVVGRRRQAALALPAAGHGRSTRRTPTPGSSRAARGCGRSSRTTGGRSRRGTSSAARRTVAVTRPTSGTSDGSDAVLAPARRRRCAAGAGARRAAATRCRRATTASPATAAPRCRCSASRALQLSPDRDPLAPHARAAAAAATPTCARSSRAAGCATCRRRCSTQPPRIAGSDARRTRRARLPARQLRALPQHAAATQVAGCALTLAQRVADAGRRQSTAVLRIAVGAPSRYRPPGAQRRRARDHAGRCRRQRARVAHALAQSATQMPPLGTDLPDARRPRAAATAGSPKTCPTTKETRP